MKGVMSVEALTRELCAYSIQGRKELQKACYTMQSGLQVLVCTFSLAIRLWMVTSSKAGHGSHGLTNLPTLVERFVVQGQRQCQQENGKWVEQGLQLSQWQKLTLSGEQMTGGTGPSLDDSCKPAGLLV